MICTCNFSHYSVLLNGVEMDDNPHKENCPLAEDGYYEVDPELLTEAYERESEAMARFFEEAGR